MYISRLRTCARSSISWADALFQTNLPIANAFGSRKYLVTKMMNRRLCSSKDGPNHTSQDASASTTNHQKRHGTEATGSTSSANPGHKERKYLWTSAEAITYATTRAYGDMETAIMSRIKESNQRRFRMYFYPSMILVSAVIYFFGSEFRKYLAQETAGLAKETLENENLKVQTQELATAVIQTVLNDKEVTKQAAKFLQQAAGAPETQEALLKLTQYILSHPDTLKEVIKLVKQLLQELSTDKVSLYYEYSILYSQYFDCLFVGNSKAISYTSHCSFG
jgi:hypothetical protein